MEHLPQRETAGEGLLGSISFAFREREKKRRPAPPQDHQLINKINQQKLGRELSWNVKSGLESDHPIAEQKCPMPFLIVDNLFVAELGCPKSQLVVRIRGGNIIPVSSPKPWESGTLPLSGPNRPASPG